MRHFLIEAMLAEDWKFGDIWWTQCSPSVGNEFRGRRPTVILRNNQLQRREGGGVITVAAMSSYKETRGPYDFLIPQTSRNGLQRPTLLKVEYIMSYDPARFLKKIGELEEEWIERLQEYLRTHFGLKRER